MAAKHCVILASGLMSLMLVAGQAAAGITISPYASVSSTKKIKPNTKTKGTEDEKVEQRQTYGLQASLSIFTLFKIQASVGQNQLTTTTKTQNAADDYDEINYEKDLNMSTDTPDKEVVLTETQRIGRLGIAFDPGFWIFILRAKGGVQATQRLVKLEEQGKPAVTTTPPIKYKPYAGAGAGVRLGPRMFFMAEYSIFMYKFPDYAPFEREVSVSYNVSI